MEARHEPTRSHKEFMKKDRRYDRTFSVKKDHAASSSTPNRTTTSLPHPKRLKVNECAIHVENQITSHDFVHRKNLTVLMVVVVVIDWIQWLHVR